jgi:ABC-type branched-chain amino acid transport systems, ATPase component
MPRWTWMHWPQQGSLRERAHVQLCKNNRLENHRLTVRRALMAKPRLAMLDEPSLGLAPRIDSYLGLSTWAQADRS